MKTILRPVFLLSLLVTVSWFATSAAATSLSLDARYQGAGTEKIAPELQATLASAQPGEMITVIVTLRQQADLTRARGLSRDATLQRVVEVLQATADATQRPLRALLEVRRAQGLASTVVSHWVFNGLSVTATPEVIQELAARVDVLTITPDAISIVPANPPEPNLSVVRAPALWDLGWRGQGIVVANLDTGVDGSHPDLAPRWRGGSNSWLDPYGQHPTTPTDLSGHGTRTMGVMVGGEAGGTAIGVAPAAQWVAVKIFNDAGSATATAIHQGFQWLLDPDGNTSTPDAPNVVNNSWAYGGPGCNLEFQLDLRSLRAAGILPVFAAGNYGPNGSTSASPANNPEAFAVGGTDIGDALYMSGSRGPSACGEAPAIYPEVVAPAVTIKTTDRYGLYTAASGTSLAAPHVAGALALLLSAYPNLAADQQAAALASTAVDLGAPGPDNEFGYGRLDVLSAYQWLQAGGNATPTPTPVPPTPTPTPVPPTPTPMPVPSVHMGDLDGNTASSSKGWTAKVTAEVHGAGHGVLSGAVVTGRWSGGSSGTSTCTTDGAGRCQVTSGNISRKAASATFTITGVTTTGLVYQTSDNHDPDGDSNGTAITINKP